MLKTRHPSFDLLDGSILESAMSEQSLRAVGTLVWQVAASLLFMVVLASPVAVTILFA